MNRNLRLFLFLALICSGFSDGEQKYHKPIVGGVDASILKHPWQVSLRYYSEHVCGGSLITANRILTAAHCTFQSFENLKVQAGVTNRSAKGQILPVEDLHIHPMFNEYTLDYDIAVVTTIGNFILDRTVCPIKLVDSDFKLQTGAQAMITGWGTLSEWDSLSPMILQEVSVYIIDQDVCRESSTLYQTLTENMFCAGIPDDWYADACKGDSGGPLTIDGQLAGIVSWGSGCARINSPGVYSNVARLRKWIDSLVPDLLNESICEFF